MRLGNVSRSDNNVGGLVGFNNNHITSSYATGNVEGAIDAGGLVGSNQDSISGSYATGNVIGTRNSNRAGGLVSSNQGSIVKSYATGEVYANFDAGGLVSLNQGSIMKSYATGSVSSDVFSGGLVNNNQGTITNSYATGSVMGSGGGGLVQNSTGEINASYWLKKMNSTLTDIGNNRASLPYDAGQIAENLKSPTRAEGIYSNWSDNDWDFGTSDQYPSHLKTQMAT